MNKLLNSLFCENECLRLQLTNLLLWEEISVIDNVSLQQVIICMPLLEHRYGGSFPSEYVPTFANDTFAIKKTQPKSMRGQH